MATVLTLWVDDSTPLNAANMNALRTAILNLEKSLTNYAGNTGGAANAYTATPSPSWTEYTAGNRITIRIHAANTGGSTLNVGGLGVKTMKKNGTAMASGDLAQNAVVDCTYDGTDFQCQVQGAGGAGGSGGGFVSGRGNVSNLVIKNDASFPDSRLTITADAVTMIDSSNSMVEGIGFTATANIATSGVNGLDTGAEGSSQWYYVWAISNGTTAESLLSLSSTAPTMPSGYTYKRLIGAIRNDGSSNFLRTYTHDDWTYYKARQSVLSAGAATSYTSVSLATFVPPPATEAHLNILCSWSTGTTTTRRAFVSMDGTNDFQQFGYASTANYSYENNGSLIIPMPTAQTVWYKCEAADGAFTMYVTGFRLNL